LVRTRGGARRCAGFAANFLDGFAALLDGFAVLARGFLTARVFAAMAFFFPRLVGFAMAGTLVKALRNGKIGQVCEAC
jgi:hypothetical protein